MLIKVISQPNCDLLCAVDKKAVEERKLWLALLLSLLCFLSLSLLNFMAYSA